LPVASLFDTVQVEEEVQMELQIDGAGLLTP
jgi:hypothetical protein